MTGLHLPVGYATGLGILAKTKVHPLCLLCQCRAGNLFSNMEAVQAVLSQNIKHMINGFAAVLSSAVVLTWEGACNGLDLS